WSSDVCSSDLRARGVSFFRIVRSAKHSGDRKDAARKCRRPNHDYAADQAVSGRENVVRTLLASATARVLATRIGREIFYQATGSDSVLVVARSNSPAPARRHSTAGNPRLARGCEVQPERSRASRESVRVFTFGLGQPWHSAREGSAAFGGAAANRA